MLLSLKKKWQNIAANGVMRAVGILIGGTVLAQAVSVLALPVLTRIYSPEDFGVLAAYIAMLSILAVVASLRLEIAIALPEKDEDGAALLILSLGSSLLISCLVMGGVLVWPQEIAHVLRVDELRKYLWMLPLGIWATASYAALQYWASRKKRFSMIARTRVSQAVVGSSTQIGGGLLGHSPLGLLVGQALKGGAGVLSLGYQAWKMDRPSLAGAFEVGRLKRNLSAYRRFPLYSTWEALANVGGVQIPMLIIAAYSLGQDAGYLLLAAQVMAIPVSLIGSAISQVYLSEAPAHERQGTLQDFTVRSIANLARAGIGPLVFIGITAPEIFPLVFGESWRQAGELVAWMVPWFLLQFLASPVSMALHVTGHQRTALALQLSGLFIRVGAVAAAAMFFSTWISKTYALSGMVFYLVYLQVILWRMRISWRRIVRDVDLRRVLTVVAGWVTLGYFVSVVLHNYAVLIVDWLKLGFIYVN